MLRHSLCLQKALALVTKHLVVSTYQSATLDNKQRKYNIARHISTVIIKFAYEISRVVLTFCLLYLQLVTRLALGFLLTRIFCRFRTQHSQIETPQWCTTTSSVFSLLLGA